MTYQGNFQISGNVKSGIIQSDHHKTYGQRNIIRDSVY